MPTQINILFYKNPSLPVFILTSYFVCVCKFCTLTSTIGKFSGRARVPGPHFVDNFWNSLWENHCKNVFLSTGDFFLSRFENCRFCSPPHPLSPTSANLTSAKLTLNINKGQEPIIFSYPISGCCVVKSCGCSVYVGEIKDGTSVKCNVTSNFWPQNLRSWIAINVASKAHGSTLNFTTI